MASNGSDKVLRNLNMVIRSIRGRTTAGIRAGANIIMGESKKNTPVDTGNLKGSHYIKMGMNGSNRPVAEIGCTAEYALYVHENLEAHHVTGTAKFLERAFVSKAKEVIKIITAMAKF